jgi:hypothetical protein
MRVVGGQMKRLTIKELRYISDALDYWRAKMIDVCEFTQADEIIELRNKIEKEIK